MSFRAHRKDGRPGTAAVEFAILLPLLAFLFAVGVDFARVYYYQLTITSCARNGAVYGSAEPTRAADTTGIAAAALADATNVSPAPAVASATELDAAGNPMVRVTVTWTFATISHFPGIPGTVNLSSTVQMRVAPSNPKNS